MPHKRAKRSVRDRNRSASGNDLAPEARKAIENEEVPKGAARVLNAAKVQQDFAERKRKGLDGDDGTAGPSRKRQKQDSGTTRGKREDGRDGQGKKKMQLRIMPGESMAHFNRRVEDAMRHSVKQAIQTSSARVRQTKKEELASAGNKKEKATSAIIKKEKTADTTNSFSQLQTKESRLKEFETIDTSAPRRLNDVAQAPPDLTKLPRKAKKLAATGGGSKALGTSSLKEGVLSLAQKAMMEEERERAIRLYREMKKERLAV